MSDACSNPVALTCEQKRLLEQERSLAEWQRFCDGEIGIDSIMRLLLFPSWVTNGADQRRELVRLVTKHELCITSNNAAFECVDCEDPVYTGCEDPEQCPSKFFGYGLLEIIKGVMRADSMAVVPYAGLDQITNGETLMWDATQEPDNAVCDPCLPAPLGAFVPESVFNLNHPMGP